MRLLSFAAATTIALCATPLGARAQTARAMSSDDLLTAVSVGDPRLSSDGRRVLFTRTTTAMAAGTRNADIWAVPADGSPPYLNLSSTQQTILGLGALRASWGPLFIEADYMLLDFGESWTGEYDGTLSPIMLGLRLPLARRR